MIDQHARMTQHSQLVDQDALEGAANLLHRLVVSEHDGSDLHIKLKYDRYQPGKITISGFASDDYSPLKDLDVPEFVFGNLRQIPIEVTAQLADAKSIYSIGILPIISRAYMTIDTDLYMWNYEENCDLASYDGISNAITKIAVAKPRDGIFQSHIHYLLIVVTTKEIIILAVNFISENSETGTPDANMFLLPDPIFKVPLDGNVVQDVIATENGRIFIAEDESLFEIDYQSKGWFSRQCKKINHSKSFLSYFLPPVSLLTGKEESLYKLCVDDSRHILYSLSENGSIQVYDLHANGNNLTKVAGLTFNQIQERAAVECRTVDPSFFLDVVNISPISVNESKYLNLVATTSKGVRLYFSCLPPSRLIGSGIIEQEAISLSGMRPVDLQLKHVRLPPGFGVSPIFSQHLNLYDAFHFHEVTIMAGDINTSESTLTVFCSSNFTANTFLTENMTQLRIAGMVTSVARANQNLPFPTKDNNDIGINLPMIVRQQKIRAEKFIILTNKGIQILEQHLPVEILSDILRRYGPDSSQINNFIRLHGNVNVCDMALTLICSLDTFTIALKDAILRLFFTMGANKNESEVRNTLPFRTRSNVFGDWSPNISVNDLSTNIRSPLQTSTPQKSRKGPQRASPPTSEIDSPSNWNDASLRLNNFSPPKMSYRHDALYLHLARIVGDIWNGPLCCNLSNGLVVSVLTLSELEWFSSQLTSYKKAVDDYYLIGTVHDFIQPLSHSPGGSKPSNQVTLTQAEKRSLLSFREILALSAEVIALWKILCEHQFSIIAELLPLSAKEHMCATNFCSMVLNGQQLCADLITCLVRHYLGDNATTSAICNQLRIVCPSLFSIEDAKATEATELIEDALRLQPSVVRTQMLSKAVKLLKTCIQKVDLPSISRLLYDANYAEGIVDLVLARAERDDSKMLGYAAYVSRSENIDAVAQEALSKRWEAYQCVTDVLDRLVQGDLKVDEVEFRSSMKSRLSLRDQLINNILESNDELANVAIFNWLLDNNMSDTVIKSRSPFLEAFLHRRVEEGGSSRYLDLLWRFHERNNDFGKAADLLYTLAHRETSTYDIDRRVAYLSQAVMCAQSSNSQTNARAVEKERVTEIRDALDVAQVQLAARDVLSSLPRNSEISSALDNLSKRLYTVQELFEEFAIPFNMPELKLDLCACSSTYNDDAIENFYLEIIREEMSHDSSPEEVRTQRLGTRLAKLAKKYRSRPEYFPIEKIIPKLISHGIHESFSTSFVDTVIMFMDTPINIAVNIFGNVLRMDPFYQFNKPAFRYLVNSAMHIFSRSSKSLTKYQCDQRVAICNKCLNLIAAFLIHLSSLSTTPADSHQKIIDTLKSYQVLFENTR